MGNVIPMLGGGGGTGSDDCTATKDKVLSGYTAVTKDSDDEVVAGTMTNRGAVSQALNAGGSYTIPAGYHNGSGKVTANALSGQTSGTATAAQILTGKTAWVNGSKLTGTMANQGTKTSALNCGGSYTIPAGYHSGSGKVTANSLASQTSATAVAGNLLSGKTAWVNGNKLSGTIASMGAQTITSKPLANQTVSCSGKYMTGNITVNKAFVDINQVVFDDNVEISFRDSAASFVNKSIVFFSGYKTGIANSYLIISRIDMYHSVGNSMSRVITKGPQFGRALTESQCMTGAGVVFTPDDIALRVYGSLSNSDTELRFTCYAVKNSNNSHPPNSTNFYTNVRIKVTIQSICYI